MTRRFPNLIYLLATLVITSIITTVNAQQPNDIIPVRGAAITQLSPQVSRHTAALIPAYYPPRLPAATLYRLAIKSALQKKYATALNIFNRISLIKNKESSGAEENAFTAAPLHGPNYTDLPPINAPNTSQDPGYLTISELSSSDEEISLADFPLMQLNIDSLFIDSSLPVTIQSASPASNPVKINTVLSAFHDHRPAKAYGLFLHIKQPIPGKRKTFKWFGTVGHSFITLIKFNQDGSHVSRTFGFYPQKHFLLQATPIVPWASSDYKNDSLHSWDESLAKLITEKQFHKIIRVTRRFSRKSYHLSKTNCTDFALDIATIAGIHIEQTKGNWPMGGGNDPGDTGQSILERKYYSSTKTNNLFFVCSPELDTKVSANNTPH